MTSAEHSKALVLLLKHCLLLPTLAWGGMLGSVVHYLSVVYSFAIISLGKRELVPYLIAF